MSFLDTSHIDATNTTNSDSSHNEPFLKVGERVFDTKEDAVMHFQSAQEHISKVEGDWEKATQLVDRQQAMLDKSSQVDEILEKLNSQSSETDQGTPEFNKDDIVNAAMNAFDQRQESRTRQATVDTNWESVTNTLTKAYGDKTDEVVGSVAKENGLTIKDAEELAKAYPKAFLKMFDLSSSTSSMQVNTSSVNTQQLDLNEHKKERKSIMNMSMKDRASYVTSLLNED